MNRDGKINSKIKNNLLHKVNRNPNFTNVPQELTRKTLYSNKQKKKKVYILSFIILILLGCLYFYKTQVQNNVPKNKAEHHSSIILSNNQSNNSSTNNSFVKELTLTEAELKKWVMAILDLTPPPPTKYILTVDINEDDNLAYVYVGIDQMDGAGTFRVNENGQLEYMPYMGQFSGVDDWILISNKYLDTTLAKEYFKN